MLVSNAMAEVACNYLGKVEIFGKSCMCGTQGCAKFDPTALSQDPLHGSHLLAASSYSQHRTFVSFTASEATTMDLRKRGPEYHPVDLQDTVEPEPFELTVLSKSW